MLVPDLPEKYLGCDSKAPIEVSLLFLLFFDILLFLHPPAPGTGRQTKVNKSRAEFFHAGTLFLVCAPKGLTEQSCHITNKY